ncbi:MAG: BON domain-containing protein [Deltaproteobacteria bacterium]|nr:MAG: BON domain-containing protein [Deltaproteobacteria bacterium]
MSRSNSNFESQHPTSLSGDSEPPPFYSNLHYQEVLTTLRYGIIARKGLVLLIGAAGTGKTTLLRQLTRELDSNVTCIFESDPDVNFTDLLRLVLGNLEVVGNTRNELSMMQRCKTILRSELERGHIVSLVIDNAQRLRDETLEYLLHNFFAAVTADRDENLLQIVLAGRPELKERLEQPRLRSLKPRSDLLCQLQPLRDNEITAYIANRLRAAQLPAHVFDHVAIDRIAGYTGGNPQLVNVLCDRTLQITEGSPVSKVSPETIARAARDLGLSEPRFPARETAEPNFEMPIERDEPFRFQSADGDTTEVVGQTFLNYTFEDRRPWLWPADRNRKVVRVLLFLILLGGSAAWLQSEVGKNQLALWVGKQNGPVGAPDAPLIEKQNPLPAPAPSSENPLPQPNIGDSSETSLPAAEKPVEPLSSALTEKAPVLTEKAAEKSPAEKPPTSDPKPAPKKAPMSAGNSRQAPVAENADAQRKLLEAQVYKAIENRAIMGVDVSVINGTAYLEGRVATERQRDAAERAARSVAGVQRVRNRIAVPVS